MAEYIENVVKQTAKLDWAFPFQRTGAFPLDRSSVFSSYDDAVLYATGGEDSRGLSGSSYIGQPLSVYDENSTTITLYIIDTDRSLKEVGTAPLGDNASIEVIQDKIQLKDFGVGYYAFVPAGQDDEGNLIPSSYNYVEGFKEGLELRIVNNDGQYEIAWYEPNLEALQEINTQLEKMAEEIGKKADTTAVYTKTEVNELIAEAGHIKRKKVNSLDEIDLTASDAENYIYMVLSAENDDGNDTYDEYMVIDGQLERLGSWSVNLDNYITEEELTNNLKDYATTSTVNELAINKLDKKDGYDLVEASEIEKLKSIQANAEPNYIKSVTSDFSVTTAGQLNLNNIPVSKVSNLEELLAKKVDKQTSLYEGKETEWILLSPENQAKLASLTLGDNGDLEVSGKVNADNVEGLGSWITTNRNIVDGLYPEADQDKLATIENGAQKNYITAVNGDQLAVENGTLSILKVPVGSIEGLDSVLPPFSAVSGEFSVTEIDGVKTLNLANSYVKTSTYLTEVGNMNQLIHTVDNSTIVDEINSINLRLQWSDIG